jgi:hypothetical protein
VKSPASRALLALGLLGIAGSLASGCASQSSPQMFADPGSSPTTFTTVDSGTVANTHVLPLTGTPATPTQQNVPVVAVALPSGDTVSSGASKAETVYVEYSDSLRLLALFQSVAAVHLGSVIETRPADGTILGVTHAIFANAGGPAGFVSILDQFGVTDASNSKDPAAYLGTPDGLFTSTAALRRAVTTAKSAPPVFTFASGKQTLAKDAKPAKQLTVSVAGHAATTWTYDAARHGWTTTDPAFAGAAPRSLIVQQVDYKTVQLHHPDGAYVPSARVYGHGTETVVSGPSTVAGQWSKTGPDALTIYGDTTGVPVHLTPGNTWVLLVPTGTPVTVS